MEIVNTLCNKLFLLKRTGYELLTAISEEDQAQVREIVKVVLEEHEKETNRKITELETKIKIYEEIISKSNFAPFVEKKTKKKEDK